MELKCPTKNLYLIILAEQIKQASIIKQQTSLDTCFSGSSGNCSFLAFFHDVKLVVVHCLIIQCFSRYFFAECPNFQCTNDPPVHVKH